VDSIIKEENVRPMGKLVTSVKNQIILLLNAGDNKGIQIKFRLKNVIMITKVLTKYNISI